eukprot:3012950-Rhodomonas_salina.1
MHGLGLRERAALAPIAYVACFVEAAEACVDRTSLDGAVAAGAFDVLEGLFGPGAFDAGPGAHRFAALVAPNLPRGRVPSADAFVDAWTAAANAAALSPHRGPLDHSVLQAGSDRPSDQRLQRAITSQHELAARDALDADIRALAHTDPRREAWLSTDSFSSQWISAWPSRRDALSALEFGEIFTTYLGVESPAARPLAGRPIPVTGVRAGRSTCDAHGHNVGLAVLKGRAHADCHDAIAARVLGDTLRAGIPGSTEPRYLFANVLPPHVPSQPNTAGQHGGGRA